MTEPGRPTTPVSLDDLLKANKAQFEKIFATQMQEIGLVGASHRPPTEEDLVSASLQSKTDSDSEDVTARPQ